MNQSLREVIKSTAVRVPGGTSLLRMARAWRLKRSFGVSGSAQDVFSQTYRGNLWGDAESVSGPGSTAEYTVNLRRELPPLLDRLGVRRLLDAPCGDFNWFAMIRPQLDLDYVGGDIVVDLIARNNERYSDQRTRFIQLDLTRDPLPSVDLWLCRDVLFHLPERDVFLAIDNFMRSGVRWLLTSTHPQCRVNTDIPVGAFRPINLMLSPYGLPEPQAAIEDWIEGFPERLLGLFERSQVESAMRNNRGFARAVAARAR